MKTDAEMEWGSHEAGNAWNHQKPEEENKDFPREPSEGVLALLTP